MNRYYYSQRPVQYQPAQRPAAPRQTVYTLTGLPLAMVYVPFQSWDEPMSDECALREGTAFRELVLPFEGCRK